MKKIIFLVIVLGFVLMIGAAGGADATGTSFSVVLLLEVLGAVIMLSGMSALKHYKRYLRRNLLKKRTANSNSLCKKTPVNVKIRLASKELC